MFITFAKKKILRNAALHIFAPEKRKSSTYEWPPDKEIRRVVSFMASEKRSHSISFYPHYCFSLSLSFPIPLYGARGAVDRQ